MERQDQHSNLTWINLPYATFGVCVRKGIVTDAPPIARGWLGKQESKLLNYYFMITPETKKEINLLVERFHFVMLEFTNGKVYLLRHHHCYIDPEDAFRLLIGKGTPDSKMQVRNSNRKSTVKILYITHKLK